MARLIPRTLVQGLIRTCMTGGIPLSCRPSTGMEWYLAAPRASLVVPPGEVSEWLKEHAWKVCIRQRIEGSNPSLSAII